MAAASCDATFARMDGLILLYYLNCLFSIEACFRSKIINKPIRNVSSLTHLRFSFLLFWHHTFSVFPCQPIKVHARRGGSARVYESPPEFGRAFLLFLRLAASGQDKDAALGH